MNPMSRSAAIAASLFTLVACSHDNNVLMGRVETTMGGHRVMVTDCYQFFGTPKIEKLGEGYYRYAPCKGSMVVIRGDTLFVNGAEHGTLEAGDSVTVDHGTVRINGQ
jgi:hypothetical protein